MEKYHKIISDWILQNIENISFTQFSKFCTEYSQPPAHSISELKMQTPDKILTGNIFEYFCKLYLKNILEYNDVWLFKEIPNNLRKQLCIGNKDMGIDIIATKDNQTYAVQCKYRHRTKKLTGISWRDLSTFYALVSKTGPYSGNIIMTNTDYIKRIGKKNINEQILTFSHFDKMQLNDWLKFTIKQTNTTTTTNTLDTTEETYHNTKNDIHKRNHFLREQRLKHFAIQS